MRWTLVILLTLFDSGFSRSSARDMGMTVARDEDGPAPLLTLAHGIVTAEDQNKDQRARIPFLPTPSPYYFYWQCLKLDRVRFDCTGVSPAGSGTGCRRNNCLPEVEVVSGGVIYTFMAHQIWCVEAYREFKAEIRELLHREEIACFGAEYIREGDSKSNSGKRNSFWFLKRIKTAQGKWDYFPD